MTVPATARRAGPYTGNGVTLTFPFSFKVFSAADLRVDLSTAAGVQSVGVLNDSFTVALNADQTATPGGTVSYAVGGVATALPAGYSLAITGARALAQTTTLPTGGAYQAATVEAALDSLEMQIQQVDDEVGRSLTLSPLAPAGVTTTLPIPAANNLLAWDGTGTGVTNLPAASVATVAVAGTAVVDQFTGTGSQTVFTLTSAPGSQANLIVALSGVVQRPGADYVWVSGTTLTFTSAPPSGVPIFVRYMQALPQATIDWASVTGKPVVSIKDFGAVGDGVTDDTAAIAAAHAYAAALSFGATLRIPRGKYLVTALPLLVANVNWEGEGRLASQLTYSGTGNGLAFLNASTNSYTNLRITLRDLAVVCTNGSNTGGGLVLESCAYVELVNTYFEKFKYGHILDGCSHFRCTFTELAQQTRAGVWIVNGAERRVGQNQGFTNNIWYGSEVQINLSKTSGIYAVQDDGGVNHDFVGVNFNSGDIGARFAGVKGLRYHNNAHEQYLQAPLDFERTSREGAVYVGPCSGVDVRSNSFSNVSTYEVVINAINGAEFEGNVFVNMTVAAFFFGSNVADVRIGKNSKVVTGSARSGLPFFDGSYVQGNGNVDIADQAAHTYVSAGHAGGVQNVTPATIDLIRLGDTIYCENEDGTNGEYVLVTFLSGGVFGATFATAKAANWVIRGQGTRYTEGSWTPTIFGTTTAGTNTYTIQQGSWKRDARTGAVDAFFSVNATALSGMAGNVEIAGLPFPCANVTNRNFSGFVSYFSGLTFPAGFTQLTLIMTPNAQRAALRRLGSASAGAAVAVSEIAAPTLIIGHMRFFTH